MAKTKTSFSKDKQPTKKTTDRKPRGKAKKTQIIDALHRAGQTEAGFYDLLIQKAMGGEDAFALKEVLARIDPIKKSVMPYVDFAFKPKSSPSERVDQIIAAAANSQIPPDIALLFIQAVKYACDIEESTELKARIEALEELAK